MNRGEKMGHHWIYKRLKWVSSFHQSFSSEINVLGWLIGKDQVLFQDSSKTSQVLTKTWQFSKQIEWEFWFEIKVSLRAMISIELHCNYIASIWKQFQTSCFLWTFIILTMQLNPLFFRLLICHPEKFLTNRKTQTPSQSQRSKKTVVL